MRSSFVPPAPWTGLYSPVWLLNSATRHPFHVVTTRALPAPRARASFLSRSGRARHFINRCDRVYGWVGDDVQATERAQLPEHDVVALCGECSLRASAAASGRLRTTVCGSRALSVRFRQRIVRGQIGAW